MKKITFYLLLFLAFIAGADAFAEKMTDKYDGIYGDGNMSITLATGSPGSLGLLKAISEPFCAKNNCSVKWINRGSGASLKALQSGEADIIMVHAPEAEKQAVKEGWGACRNLIGGNEFYIAGPPSDPAGIKSSGSVKEAYKKIASSASLFFTRNDNSGTHKKEMMIWEMSGITPSGAWYVATNDFMEPTLMRADQEKGYFMTDSSTWYAEKKKIKNLEILFKGDPVLVNVYHIMRVPEEKRSEEMNTQIAGFIDFVISTEGQKIIGEFGISEFGGPLYINAEKAAHAAH